MSGEDKMELLDGLCDEVDFCLTEFSCFRRPFIKSSEDMTENAEKNANEQDKLRKLSLDEVIERLREINLMLTAGSESKTASSSQKVKECDTQQADFKQERS